MKLLIYTLFLLPSLSWAVDLSLYEGTFAASESRTVELRIDDSDLVVTFTGNWNSAIRGNPYLFRCNDANCSSGRVGFWTMELRLLQDGNILMTSTPVDRSAVAGSRILRPVGQGNSGRWDISQSDKNGSIQATASVVSSDDSSTLMLQCLSPSPDVAMVLQVNDVLWKAAGYATEIEKKALQITMQVQGKKFEMNNWELRQGNLIVRLDDVVADEIAKLQAGSVAKFKISAVSSTGEVQTLDNLTFSLAGSSKALIELRAACSTAVLP